ncbi:unnamed protein product [Protopolystoma xenopodis]|uniref:Uncharacterized protein n=1 Tax=Protopolystoma xenopodis TaxID=117903 RepID=A0A448XPM2_9PLAT|nr:unnamed protein product [Protopolystoma xenopodis]
MISTLANNLGLRLVYQRPFVQEDSFSNLSGLVNSQLCFHICRYRATKLEYFSTRTAHRPPHLVSCIHSRTSGASDKNASCSLD